MIMNHLNKIQFIFILLLVPFAGFCQGEVFSNSTTYFSNALFLTLLVTILLLAILIVALGGAFKNIADSDYLIVKFKKEEADKTNAGKIVTTLLIMLSSLSMFSQQEVMASIKDDGTIGGLDYFTFFFMAAIVVLELIVLALMFFQFNLLIRTTKKEITEPVKKESKLMQSLVGAVAIEEEDSILLDHDYDGIRELDNDLPPWWKYGFYLTIVASVVYMLHYHVLGTGDLQLKEYEKDIAQAKLAVDEYMRNSANNVDENTVKLLTEESDLAAGKDIFIANCAACHGKLGEGSVGPNLTDDYWLHGGSIQDVFKSVKYGWVEKGMKAWKEDLSPIQIAQITSFMKTLRGTNPINSKAAQGDLFVEENISSNDSILIKTDSLSIVTDPGSTKK